MIAELTSRRKLYDSKRRKERNRSSWAEPNVNWACSVYLALSEYSLHDLRADKLDRIGHQAIDEVVKKASVIVQERRNYGSNTTRVYLTSSLPCKQVLILETATQLPEAVTKQVVEWLNIK